MWSISLSNDSEDNPIVAAYRRDLLHSISELGEQIPLLASRVEKRTPLDRTGDSPGAGSRYQDALIELWRRLASLCKEQVSTGHPQCKITDQPLRNVLMKVRESRPAKLLSGFGPTVFLRELRQPGEQDPNREAYHRLAARVRRTWKLNVGKRASDGDVPEAFAHFAEEEKLTHSEAKRTLIEVAFAQTLQDVDARLTVRVGQQWRKRTLVPIRSILADGSETPDSAERWAETASLTATPQKASDWIEDLPVYRAWKVVVNATIRHAEDYLLSSYGQVEINVSEKNSVQDRNASIVATASAEASAAGGEAEVQARLTAHGFAERVEKAGLTQRQAEAWLRTEDLPPGFRRQLADSLNVELPEHKQTQKEAANDLGIARGTVGSHKHRATEKIQRAFGRI